jgi:hypothetical protein
VIRLQSRIGFLCLCFASTAICREDSSGLISFRAPEKLRFEELLQLAVQEPLPANLADHLKRLLSEPFISDEATLSGVQPIRPVTPGLGPLLRVAEWNIERGVNEQRVELSFSDSHRFEQIAEETYHDTRLRDLRKALAILRSADVIILDEVDLGMTRTDYRDIAKDLAQALHFNYVYGVEFVELNRLYLGEKSLDRIAEQRPHDPHEVFGVDPGRYRGLEGTAVLTRYPIRNARIVRLPECYDWFHGEIQEISDLERVKRWSAEELFEERIRRQVRRGGRMALIVDIGVPEAAGQQVTIVAPI